MAQKTEVRLVKLEDKFSQILKTLTTMNDTIDGLDHIIRGNGTPGLVTTQSTQELRIKALESAKKSWGDLLILIASGGVVALLTTAVQHFIR